MREDAPYAPVTALPDYVAAHMTSADFRASLRDGLRARVHTPSRVPAIAFSVSLLVVAMATAYAIAHSPSAPMA